MEVQIFEPKCCVVVKPLPPNGGVRDRGGACSSVSFLLACSVSVHSICEVNGKIYPLSHSLPHKLFKLHCKRMTRLLGLNWKGCVYLNLSKLELSQNSENVLPHFTLLAISWVDVSAVLYSVCVVLSIFFLKWISVDRSKCVYMFRNIS